MENIDILVAIYFEKHYSFIKLDPSINKSTYLKPYYCIITELNKTTKIQLL